MLLTRSFNYSIIPPRQSNLYPINIFFSKMDLRNSLYYNWICNFQKTKLKTKWNPKTLIMVITKCFEEGIYIDVNIIENQYCNRVKWKYKATFWTKNSWSRWEGVCSENAMICCLNCKKMEAKNEWLWNDWKSTKWDGYEMISW
jgi:hypothetical protein